MPGEIAAAAIGAGASLVGAGGTAVANGKLNKKNREWQEKMSALNFERNKELFDLQTRTNRMDWEMQNEYNSPVNQVKRLREAGLNPNLLYGNGSTVATGGSIDSPNAFSADTSGAPGAIPYDFSQASNGIASAIAAYQNWQINNLNMQKVRAEKENIDANTLYTQAMRSGQLTKNSLLGVDLSWADKNYAIDYISKRTGIGKTQSEIFLNNARKREVELGIYQNSAAFETKLALMQAQTWQAKGAAMQAFGNFLESRDRIASGLYGSQAALNRSSASLNNQQYDFLDPYYRNGYNPNWSIGQATAASAYNVTKNAVDSYDYYGRKSAGWLKGALKKGIDFVDRAGARYLRNTTW